MATMQFSEQVAVALRSLYARRGYAQYKMSKFEEYDLYARNKDFLISDHVITFTDLSGKLMALKPDVTLSIVKNSADRPDAVQKLYYHENVYRPAKGSHGFKEIMQVGLEILGRVDDYCITEALSLAAESLSAISADAVLDISHLGLLTELMDSIGIPPEQQPRLVKFISGKNAHELTALCRESGIRDAHTELLRTLISTAGAPEQVLPQLETLLTGLVNADTWTQFRTVIEALGNDPMLRIDFSVVNDLHYYNGFVIKGFVQGLPGSVLSGGQYDKLMQKMNRSAGAIGFAVYLDMLERLEQPGSGFDVDTVLLYDAQTPLAALRQAVAALTEQFPSVLAQAALPEGLRYRQLLKLTDSEVQTIEKNA